MRILSIILSLFLFILLSPKDVSANAAQPGIRQAGGAGGFTLLFPEDSTVFQKIQMQEERVNIQLYKNFAVVKGQYWMKNDSKEDVSMQSGYPIQASYGTEKDGYHLTEIYFDTLYQIQVKINGNPVSSQGINYVSTNNRDIEYYHYADSSKWYTWETIFPAESTTLLEVYFILNTNDASIAQGYNRKYYNSFVYVLETGATWKPPIGKGSIIIEMMDGLNTNDIQGISPETVFGLSKNHQQLLYQFKNLEPTREDNIAITYHDQTEGFDFRKITEKSNIYFKEIDELSSQGIQAANFKKHRFKSPFDIPDNVEKTVTAVLIGLVILSIAFIAGLIWLVVKYLKRNK